MVMLIGLIGQKYSGKDTLADFLVSHYHFKKYAFATPVKEICQIMFHLKPEQMTDPILKEIVDTRWDLSPRQLMQKVGTDMIRDMWGHDFWLKHMDLRISNNDNIVISDVRFPNEAHWIKSHGGFLIRILNTDSQYHVDTHPSETLQSHIHQDISIVNHKNGIPDFHQHIKDTLEQAGLLQ